jgi:pimeloyl-ACP methyl ester carboxylesterase
MLPLLVLSLIVLAVLAAGIVYQVIGSRRDARLLTAPGRWVSLENGSRLYVHETGSGEATVLFESGIGATNLNWRGIQRKVARFARTAAYDRAGLGWSSPCRTPRTPGNVAAELHEMLVRGQIQPPYLLVGHSFGGLVMRRFALTYPDEVSGVVLVDPMRCEEWPPLDPAKESELLRGRRLVRIALPLSRCGLARLALTSLFRRSGKLWERLSGLPRGSGRYALERIRTEVSKMPREVWPSIAAHWSRPAFYVGLRRHIESIHGTVEEMDAAEPISQIPIVVLTPVGTTPLDEEDLNRIGDCARQVIALKSAHWIHLDEPELVIATIRSMASEAANAEKLTVSAALSGARE